MMFSKSQYNHIAAAAIFICGSAFITGCTSDTSLPDDTSIQEGIPTEVSFSLRSTTPFTVGDGVPAGPTTKYEKIHSWWLVFVDKNGKVRKIISRDDATTLLTSSEDVEEETFKCTMPSGVYDIYAFANIDATALKNSTGISFTIGENISLPEGVSNIETAFWNTSLNNYDATSSYIPMSGLMKGVRVKNNIEEHFSIEVVRMVAKLELSFTNSDTQDVTIHSISVDPVTTSPISLFPFGASGAGYSHLGQSPYSPIDEEHTTYGLLTVPLTSDNLVKGKKADEDPETKSITFYLQESLSDRANDRAFTIGITVSHKDGVAQFEQYNITRDILQYINRNDHIFIPVNLSRYDIDVDAVFYPPIGGYPAASSTTDPEGSQIFTFGTEGDFAVVAHVTDKDTGRHLAPNYYKVSVSDLSDPSGIFSTDPAVVESSTSMPDEVTGTLGKATGKASFTLKVDIYDNPHYQPGAKVKNSYSRKIFIVRSN